MRLVGRIAGAWFISVHLRALRANRGLPSPPQTKRPQAR